MKILVINPGSTSTKMAVYEDEQPILLRNITHTAEELAPFDAITEQQDFRKQLVLDELAAADIPLEFDAVIGRGGLVKPIAGGVYEINQQMIDDTLHGCVMHNHACNLGCLIAHEIAKEIGCRSFIADPGVVDELSPLARISGSPLMPRICIWHALNQRAIARRYARGIGKEYEDLNLIICHLGGGISVAAHEHGRAIDANNALDGEGPFSPERAGSLPAADLIRLCFSGKYSEHTPSSSSMLCSTTLLRTSLQRPLCSVVRLTPSCLQAVWPTRNISSTNCAAALASWRPSIPSLAKTKCRHLHLMPSPCCKANATSKFITKNSNSVKKSVFRSIYLFFLRNFEGVLYTYVHTIPL